ncbi:MAG: hypothetical protein U1F87_14465 [Kiritimatiellia bacterium]
MRRPRRPAHPEAATDAVLAMVESSGLLLGVEAHSYFDLARAAAWQPLYVQIPAVEGLAHFTRMARLCEMPVLAAGGVPVESASSFRASGAAGI